MTPRAVRSARAEDGHGSAGSEASGEDRGGGGDDGRCSDQRAADATSGPRTTALRCRNGGRSELEGDGRSEIGGEGGARRRGGKLRGLCGRRLIAIGAPVELRAEGRGGHDEHARLGVGGAVPVCVYLCNVYSYLQPTRLTQAGGSVEMK